MRRSWRDLLDLAESPIPSRAITLIADKVSVLDYIITPKAGFEDGKYDDEIAIVKSVIENPNHEDGDWPTFVRQIVEDQLTFDFGCWEYVDHPKYIDDNGLLGLFAVPGFTIEKVIGWDGTPSKPRWAQRIEGYESTRPPIPLLDSQLEVLINRKRTGRVYGISPLEVAITLMDALLGVQSYQAEVASNTYPAFLFFMGKEATEDQVTEYRRYWEQEIRGLGRPGIIGNMDDPKTIQLKTMTDEGLYLQYEEMLIRILAFTFKLKPQDFSVERDVNRSQGEVSQAASIEEAIRPYALALQRRITARVMPKIALLARKPRIKELMFFYDNIDPWDEKEQTDITRIELETDQITIDEARAVKGRAPLENGFGDLTITEYRAMMGPQPIPLGPVEDDERDPLPEDTDDDPEPEEE